MRTRDFAPPFLDALRLTHLAGPLPVVLGRGKHEDNHRPKMNTGVVIKQNANQRYATTAATAAVLRSVAAKAGVVLQVGAAHVGGRGYGQGGSQPWETTAVVGAIVRAGRTLWCATTARAAARLARSSPAASACAPSVRPLAHFR